MTAVYQKLIGRRLLAGICLAFAAGATALASDASAATLQVQSITPWMSNAAPMGWSSSLNRVFYNSAGPNGMFNGFSANPDGSDPQCVTCTVPSYPSVGAITNRGVSDVSPNGQYMLLEVERPHPGQIGADYTQPGKGGDNDVWLATTDGQQAWPLTNIDAPGQITYGTMWARFDRTGNEIVWASMYSPAIFNLGLWQLKVANIVWTDGVPSLADVRTIPLPSGQFYEPYGFTPDDQHVIFASSYEQPSDLDNAIWTVGLDGTGLTRVSPPTPTGAFPDYDEFAFYTPSGNSVIYGTTHDTLSGGMDYWMMNPDGSDAQRLTWFNAPWNTESLGYSVVGGLAFNPNNPDQFVAGIANSPTASTLNAVMITLAPSTSTSGLTEQMFANESFGSLVSSTVSNPSQAFEADASPAAGMPATSYSIRWSGTVTPPTTGSYSFCSVAEYSDELYVGGTLLVNGMYSYGGRRCATVNETAGVPVAIRLDYMHGTGVGYTQLSWMPPGASTVSAIPSSALSPTPVYAPPAAGGAKAAAGTATASGAGSSDSATIASTPAKKDRKSAHHRKSHARAHAARAARRHRRRRTRRR